MNCLNWTLVSVNVSLCFWSFLAYSNFFFWPTFYFSPQYYLPYCLLYLFLPSFAMYLGSLLADSHVQLCKWLCAFWLWCGGTVVCLRCQCGSLCLPACYLTLSGPNWLGQMVGWLIAKKNGDTWADLPRQLDNKAHS